MADLVRVSLGGDMPSGEKWTINPVFKPANPLAMSQDEAAAMATAIAATSFSNVLQDLNVPLVTFRTVRVEARTVTGELQAVGEASKASPTPGTGTQPHPFQTSMCLSLVTGSAGARGKGRLYFPATSVQMTASTLRLYGPQVTGFVTGMNTWLAAVRTAIRGVGGWNTAVLGVWSRTDELVRPVLTLRAGDIADTQRRRRDAISEAYTSVAVSP